MDNKALAVIKKAPLYKTINTPLKYLRHPSYNPRTITETKMTALMNSLDRDPEFMKVRPIFVNVHEGREGIIIAGNQRYEAALSLGWDKAPAMFVDVPLEQEKQWNVKDNINQGEWEQEQLSELLTGLHDQDVDLMGLGWSNEELVDYLDPTVAGVPPEEDPDYSGGTTPSKGRGARKKLEMIQISDPLIAYFQDVTNGDKPSPELIDRCSTAITELNKLKTKLLEKLQDVEED